MTVRKINFTQSFRTDYILFSIIRQFQSFFKFLCKSSRFAASEEESADVDRRLEENDNRRKKHKK
jgi:hypothetical protein